VEAFTSTIAYVDPNLARKRLGENKTQFISRLWPGDDELLLLIVTFGFENAMSSIVSAVNACRLGPSGKI